MEAESLLKILQSDFYTGVPDSRLRALCDCLMRDRGTGSSHVIAANEGNAVAMAAGQYMATGKPPVIYMQNSGIGNAINPVLSLTSDRVYAIPCIFIVGWRGEPGSVDEPQHIAQGEVTIRLLEDVGIKTYILDAETEEREVKAMFQEGKPLLEGGRSIAFVVKKDALENGEKQVYGNPYQLKREQVIRCITDISGRDILVATTGKTGRELFEIREQNGQGHETDFLTVGSMGHGSSIALGIALSKPMEKVWCLDGDGAALMHMGAMAVIGNRRPKNLIHVIINNEAHESVGGQPTAAATVDFTKIALGCGYDHAVSVESREKLMQELVSARSAERLGMIEVKCAIGSRSDLGRPTISPRDNLRAFMARLTE